MTNQKRGRRRGRGEEEQEEGGSFVSFRGNATFSNNMSLENS